VKVARPQLLNNNSDVTPMTVLLLMSEYILDLLQKLRLLKKWETAMYINPVDLMSCTTQSQEAFLKNVKNKYCAKYQQMSAFEAENIRHRHFFPCVMASGFGESAFDASSSSSDDEEY
jgi:hypothetical protein